MSQLKIELTVTRRELQVLENALFNHLKYLEEEIEKNSGKLDIQKIAALEMRPTQDLLQTLRMFKE